MSPAQGATFMRPLRLPNGMLSRRKSDASEPGPAPQEPLPPLPSIPAAYAQAPRSLIVQPVTPRTPTAFRALPPVANPEPPTPPKPDNSSISVSAGQDLPPFPTAEPTKPSLRRRQTLSYDRRHERELQQKPLHQSLYGRCVISLLMQQWVIAPSGLAACALTDLCIPGLGDDPAQDLARYIDMLVCGAQAYAEPYAGVIAVKNLAQLNRLFIKSGLSPIVPCRLPEGWQPLCARQPPAFLLQDFIGVAREAHHGIV